MLRYRVGGVAVLVALIQSFWSAVWAVGCGSVSNPVLAGAGWGAFREAAFWAVLDPGRSHPLVPWILGVFLEAFWRIRNRTGSPGGRSDDWLDALERTLWPVGFVAASWIWSGKREWFPWETLPFWSGAGLGLCLSHRWLPAFLRAVFFSESHFQKAVLVGAETGLGEVAAALREYRAVGVDPVGWVGDEEPRDAPAPVPWLGRFHELDRVLEQHGASQVVVVDGPRAGDAARRAFAVCQRRGIRLLAARTKVSNFGLPIHWESGTGVDFGAILKEPLQSPWNRFSKRGLDLLVAVPAVCFAVIPMAAILWMVMRFQSRGPVFHRQTRHGKDNRPFRIWKFRTMHCGNFAQAQQASRGDNRIYPFGAWMRRHSLDELPQFLNVLSGEMSTVGPRPHLVEHTEVFGAAEGYHWRSYVKPGITGLAQIHGCRGEVRSPEDVRKRVRWDVQYVEHWTLVEDIRIILRTFHSVLSPPETAL